MGFFRRRRFSSFLCFLKRHSSGSNRTPPHALVLLCSCSLFVVPPHLLFRPFWPCVPLLGVFFGVPFWAPRVFGILLEHMGLELARPFRGPFLGTRGGKGVSWLLVLGFCFPLLFCSAASHVLLEGPANGSTYGRPGALDVPPLARVRARGSPSEGGGLVPSCSGISLPYFVWQRVTGTLGRTASRAFLLGRGRFCLPPQALFFTRTFFSRPRFFFFVFFFFGLRGLRMPWRARRRC